MGCLRTLLDVELAGSWTQELSNKRQLWYVCQSRITSIASKILPTVRLTEIFRQAEQSQIVVNAHLVNKGMFPKLFTLGEKSDFFFVDAEPENIAERIIHLVKEYEAYHCVA